MATKQMTSRQLTAICRIFTEGAGLAPADQIQRLLHSGCLADLRDANFNRLDRFEFRNKFREVCGLPSLNTNGQVDHIINCGADPFVPDYWKVEKHTKFDDLKLTNVGGALFLNGKKIAFHLSPNQMGDKSFNGEKLLTELAKEPVLNANVLDYLYAHPYLIPDSWKVDDQGRMRSIFFWGTVYRDYDGNLFVRYLCWHDGRWGWGGYWLGDDWDVLDPAAVLASE